MPNIRSIFHINVNVTDFERSLKFYEMLGFHVVRDFGDFGDRLLARGLGARNATARSADDPRRRFARDTPGPYRMEAPPTEGRPYSHLFHAGACRIALRTKTLRADYEELKGRGVRFSPNRKCSTPKAARLASFA